MAKNKNDEVKEKGNKIPLRISVVIFIFLDAVIAILLLVLFPQKCQKVTSSNSNLNSKETYVSKDLTNKLLTLVNTKLELEGYEDEVNNVITFTYKEETLGSFNISYSVTSDDYLYIYKASNCSYVLKENETNSVVKYLITSNDNELNGKVDLYKYELDKETVIDKPSEQSVISYKVFKSPANNKYLCGVYCKEETYYIYHDVQVVDNVNPFTKPASMIVKNTDLLFDYYTSLLNL